jgi:anti-sigma B factor antagonist
VTFIEIGKEAQVPLTLNTRGVGDVTIVRCSGRIVAGGETESLRGHIIGLLEDRKGIVLHLGEVVFIDSSGLGMLVRLLTNTRRASGDLKLCNVPQDVHKILRMTNLITLFDTHESEEDAVSAFYRRNTTSERVAFAGPSVLCVDQSADVLAYLREVLRSAGYSVLTNSHLHDSLILIRATRPSLIILGPNLMASPGTQQNFRAACATAPVVELGNEFSTLDGGQAASELLEKIRVRLSSQDELAS